ncbi:hypothetical protein GDO86_003493 [Hymenochirus boettgeri]|uniref:Centrosomal protein of 85 kDa-like CC4 coiled-coil domain-containing protein n=1 Tax=Hymenochirus boettgeri TaxID=247094 RepID=A0A8T2K9U3_9PIPI|nr:hypothetical protein GDO86_003493 [Hymenochirus boettgeri]KAG8451287.1 hypothetical protein GDO86_003493 [Hymenochirus boettgeri]
MATVERKQNNGFQRIDGTEPSQASALTATDWQTPLVSGKAVSRFTTGCGVRMGSETAGLSCLESTEDFCNASGSMNFQPIRSQVTIPTAHVMPSTFGTLTRKTSENVVCTRLKESALQNLLPSDHTLEETRKFEMPNIEPTLNQSAILNAFCTDTPPSASEGIIHSKTESYSALPEKRETVEEIVCKSGQPSTSFANRQGWRPEQCTLQRGEFSAWRQQQTTENMRMRMEQLQLASACPAPSNYCSGLQSDSNQWEIIQKAREDILMEKKILVERQRRHILHLNQNLRENEVHVHNTLLGQASSFGDLYMIRMQELQGEVSFLRAQFAEKVDTSSREKAELEKKLCICETENRDIREAMKETAQKHAEYLRKQEERVKGRDRHINSLKKMCQKETEQNKEKQQRIETLERYLADLPTVQDHQKQMLELKGLQEKNIILEKQVSELEKRLVETRSINREKEVQLIAEKHRAEELSDTIDSLKKEIENFQQTEVGIKEKRLTRESEDLRQEVQSLQKEQECLKKVVENQKKKMEQMCDKMKGLEDQVAQEEGTGHALKEEAQRKEISLQQLRAAVKELAVQNQDLMEQNVTLQERLHQRVGEAQPAELEPRNLVLIYTELNICLRTCDPSVVFLHREWRVQTPISPCYWVYTLPRILRIWKE